MAHHGETRENLSFASSLNASTAPVGLRMLVGEHRFANLRQQQAIEAVIASDGQERLFLRHPASGCLLAMEN